MNGSNSIRLLFILLSFQIYQAHEPYRANHIRTASFDTVEKDRALTNHVLEVIHEYEPLDCGFACLQTTGCQSYNLRKESTDAYECELSSSTKTQHPNDFEITPGVTYYGTDTFPGLGCSIADCPEENCKETKLYPFYECQNVASVVTFPSSAEYNKTIYTVTSFDAFSICFWFQTRQAKQAAFLGYKSESNNNKLNLAYNEGKMIVQMNDVPTNNASFDVPPIEDGQWHHVCTTWNSSSGHVDIYVDGGLRSYDSGATHFKGEQLQLAADGVFTIGRCELDATELSYTGKISELHIWDYVFTGDKVKEIAKNCTVGDAAAGNIIKWESDFVTTHDDNAEKRICSLQDPIQLDSDLHFLGEDADYHVDHPNMPFLDKFTISWWLKTSWIPTAESQLMAIASMILEQQTQLLIAIRGTFEINLEWRSSQSFHKLPPINDDRWHHMLITWTSNGGRWEFFLDGVHRSSIDDIGSGKLLQAESVLVIGQNGHRSSISYSPDEVLNGSLSRFNIWDRILPVELIVALAKDPGSDEGNIHSWRGIYNTLKYLVDHNEPSTVVSSAGGSNIALTMTQFTEENYARIAYDGPQIGKVTVCAWIYATCGGSLQYPPEPSIISYAAEEGSSNEFFITYNNERTRFGLRGAIYRFDGSTPNDKKWRHFCYTWDTEIGEAHVYLEGKVTGSKTGLSRNILLKGKGFWAFTNEHDSYEGSFQAHKSFQESIAQLNVWNYLLPLKSMEGFAYGGTSVEGNLFRWTDIVANYNPNGSVDATQFNLYLPDAVSQKKRDEFCNGLRDTQGICSENKDMLYARIGPKVGESNNGYRWRCYCEQNVGMDKNVQVINSYYHSSYGSTLENL